MADQSPVREVLFVCDFDRHDPRVWRDSANANAIPIAHDDSRRRSTMSVGKRFFIIERIIVIVNEVIARQDSAGQIDMVGSNAGVKIRDNNAITQKTRVPGRYDADALKVGVV